MQYILADRSRAHIAQHLVVCLATLLVVVLHGLLDGGGRASLVLL